jgi:predicted Zn-dependent protease
MIDPYASCPCGSGKKFKWCCQPIHDQIEKALNQQQAGQGEAALHTIEEVVRANPKNTEAIGRKAQLLHVNGRMEEAEKTLDEAFAVNPQYPYGFLLRGLFRLDEGEQEGAILLFRKATELYAPDTVDQLSFLFEQIGNYELHRNNLIAARYAFGQCVRLIPENQDLRQAFDSIFGPQSRTPEVARKDHRLVGFDAKRPPEWQEAFSKGNTGKLSEAVKLFEGLAKQPKADPAASYNAGLIRAWLGENAKAIEHFDKYVEKEPAEEKAAAAAALCEVLRLGDEMIERTDYVQYRHLLRFGNPDTMVNLIQEWDRAGRLVGVRSDQENGVLVGLLLQESTGLIGAAAPAAVGVGAQFAVVRDTLSLTHTNPQTLGKIVEEAKGQLGSNILEEKDGTATAQFGEVLLETLMLPPYGRATPELLVKSTERAEQFFEEEWANRSLKSLGGKTPNEAAKEPALRRKLLGDIQFLEQCYFAGAPKAPKGQAQPPLYDFARLRNKLGVDTAPPPPQIDFAGMNAAELGAVDVEALTADQMEKAYRAAVNLEARELAKKFIQAIIAKADANKPDMFPFFKYLVDQAQTQADWDAAIRHVEEGLKVDAEGNQSQRRNDYELRRGQLLAKKGDAEKASEAFQVLIDRVPNESKFRGSAAEAMLGLRQGSRALKFAEGGLEAARKAGNRDLEAYFQELVAAAKKQGG